MKTETARPTPGPWKWLRHKPNGQDSQWECWLVSDAPIESIPHRDRLIIPMRYDCAAFPYAGTDANARLIAAAPELAVALRMLADAVDAEVENATPGGLIETARHEARAALATAEKAGE